MSVIVNRRLLLDLLQRGEPLMPYATRAVGKTTSAVLSALGESYHKPGEWVLVADPDQSTHFMREWLVSETRKTLQRLQLDLIEVAHRQPRARGERFGDHPATPGVYVRNKFCERLT
jgi:hypothetical protein